MGQKTRAGAKKAGSSAQSVCLTVIQQIFTRFVPQTPNIVPSFISLVWTLTSHSLTSKVGIKTQNGATRMAQINIAVDLAALLRKDQRAALDAYKASGRRTSLSVILLPARSPVCTLAVVVVVGYLGERVRSIWHTTASAKRRALARAGFRRAGGDSRRRGCRDVRCGTACGGRRCDSGRRGRGCCRGYARTVDTARAIAVIDDNGVRLAIARLRSRTVRGLRL